MFRDVFIIIILTLALLLILTYFMFDAESENINSVIKTEDSEQVIWLNDVRLRVDVADEPQEQAQGLSGKNPLTDDGGMLFVFQSPHIPSFWMREMRFPLDMLWIDENGKIVEITKNISPETYPNTFSPSSPIKYVLEVNAGWSDANKIKVGDMMTGL